MLELYKNIKALRLDNSLSQEQLAKMVGYKDRSSIAKIEAGKVDITQSKIKEFAIALNTTPSALMGITAPEGSEDKKEAVPEIGDSLSPLDARLMDLLRYLTTDQKKMLLAQIETLLRTQE